MDHREADTTSPRRRSASASLLIALVLGLILATSGGAVAGKQITGKQIKNNSITGKDVKNKSLGLHDLRPSDVDKLADGILPSGKTVVGGGIVSGDAPSDSRYARGIAPLPFKTTVPLSIQSGQRNIYFGNTSIAYPGQANPGLCNGSANNPTAAPGIMCVYISGSTTNAGNESFVFPGANANPDGADSTFFYIGINAPAPGEVLVRFVWAYTAP